VQRYLHTHNSQIIESADSINRWTDRDWRHGSSGRTPTFQVWSSEFKPQSQQRNKQKQRNR
jgi:hypothetical protein